jgi:signal transduction histidine kinase
MTEQTGDKRADPPSLGLTRLSRVRLDELLQEMLDRVGDVMASRERLRALLDAVVGIGSDLDLRSTLQRIVQSACALVGARYGALGVIGADRELTPSVDVSGPVDSAVPEDIVPELLAVLREALSNVARHAHATAVRVSVRAAGGEVLLRVEDDGAGMDVSVARGGIVNMGERAHDLGGTFEAGPGASGGTLLIWRVPIAP